MTRKIGKVPRFLLGLTEALRDYLPSDWEMEGLPHPRMRKRYPWGSGALVVHTTVRGFPSCNLFLSYGVTHDTLAPSWEKLQRAQGYEPLPSAMQFWTDTRNCPLNGERTTVFVEDYNHCDFERAAADLLRDSYDNLLAYYERFSDLRAIREALEKRDRCMFGLAAAREIAAIDVVLGDLNHLGRYRDRVPRDYDRRMIDETLAVLGAAFD